MAVAIKILAKMQEDECAVTLCYYIFLDPYDRPCDNCKIMRDAHKLEAGMNC